MYPLDQLSYAVSASGRETLLFTYTFETVSWAIIKHLATGYLVYSVVERVRRRSLAVGPVVVALIGSVAPDLIDKPLTWLGVLAYGRSFAHSLFTTVALLAVAVAVTRRVNRPELSGAFAAGYLSHILVDMFGEVFGGLPYVDTAFLFWPVVVKQPIGVARPTLPVSEATLFGAITAGAVVLWVLDGMVGVSDARRFAHEWMSGR